MDRAFRRQCHLKAVCVKQQDSARAAGVPQNSSSATRASSENRHPETHAARATLEACRLTGYLVSGNDIKETSSHFG